MTIKHSTITLITVLGLLLAIGTAAAQPQTPQSILDAAVAEHDVTGFTLSIHTGEAGTAGYAAGIASHTTQEPLSPAHQMYAGSVTKTFVAATVLQLVEEGTISMDDTLANWFPDYPNAESITVSHLLGMTSGTFDYFRNDPNNPFIPVLMQDITHNWAPDEIISVAGTVAAPAQPGEMHIYSNTDYIILGRIIELETGNPLHEELNRRMFTSLGMENTYMAGVDEMAGEVAHGYLRDSAFLFGSPEPMTTTQEHYAGIETLSWAAGGIITTGDDLARGMYTLLNGDTLDEDTLTQMTTPGTLIGENGQHYGYGIEFYETTVGSAVGHAGSIPGFGSLTLYLPQHDMSIAITTNDEYGEQALISIINEVLEATVAS